MDKLKSKDWVVRDVGISTARNIVEAFHYSGGATNTRVYTHGLFKKGEDFFDDQCLGVAWWLPPTKNAAIATYDGDWRKVLSLTRLAINPEVPSNAIMSWEDFKEVLDENESLQSKLTEQDKLLDECAKELNRMLRDYVAMRNTRSLNLLTKLRERGRYGVLNDLKKAGVGDE